MPQTIEVRIPPMGEDFESARMLNWSVQPGETFRAGDILFEIETDKSVVEIPAEHDGRMIEHLVLVDSQIGAETPVARIDVEDEVVGEGRVAPAASNVPDAVPPIATSAGPASSTRSSSVEPEAHEAASASGVERMRVTPAARRALRELGVDPSGIHGSGPGGRVVLADVPAAEAISGLTGSRVAASSRPLVVLLHGMFGDREVWSAVAHRLDKSGWPVRALDLPGHGNNSAPASTLNDAVDDVARQIADLRGRRYVLVGHSFGAAVAIRLAIRPELAPSALVLLSPAGLGNEIAQPFLDGVLQAEDAGALGRALAWLTAGPVTLSRAYLEDLHRRLVRRSDEMRSLGASLSVNGLQRIDLRTDLTAISCPVSLIHGRADRIIPWQHALNAPARVALHLVPEVGHMPQWEAVGLTTEVVTAF